MSQSRLKVGVVGAGIGAIHIESYLKLPNSVELVALCDVDEARLTETADLYNIPERYTDAETMFRSGKIEAVSLCLPNHLHAPLAISALEAGLSVLGEKPLADTVSAGQQVVEAATNSDGIFMMTYNRRYRPDLLWIKQALQENLLGDIYQIKAGWVREGGIPGWGGWFTNKKVAGGGPLIDLGIHMLDAVLWLIDFPKPLTVSGMTHTNFGPQGTKTYWKVDNPNPQYTVEDSALAFIRLTGNIAFTLEASWASHARPGLDDFYITLHGSKGTVEWYVANYTDKDTLTFYTELGGVPVATKPLIKKVGENDHTYAIREFVHCVQNRLPPTATAEEGLMALQIVEAIYNSAETGCEVAL
ncbi:Gfo/Idh/MocA family oxidoreductase [Anaerolineales bacterium HSG24]|nr:Gfo/Idh/MocA family oxidoreductase [Anaerolineales bacterium HSG24]